MKAAAILVVCTSLSAWASIGESRELKGFDRLSLSNAVEATVTQGDAIKVKVSADSADTLKKVKTEVKDGTLSVRLDEGWCFRCEVKVEVVMPKLARLDLSGASKAQVDGAFGPQLELEASGASKATVRGLKAAALKAHASGASELSLTGTVTALEIEASGSSEIEAPKLACQNVKVELSGASSAELRAEAGIDADLSGASTVTVSGKPAQRHVDTSGASRVKWKD